MQAALGRLGAMHAATELYDIEDPGPNDVLFGRGTGSNMHSGNIRFRALIQKYKPVYRDTPKKMKPSVSTKVVAIWRSQDPPGRFLTRSDRFHGSRRTFYDVGDAMARRKAAQCLREKTSKERMMQKERANDEFEEGSTEASDKSKSDDDSKLQEEDEAEIVPSLEESFKAATNNDEDILGACSSAEKGCGQPQNNELDQGDFSSNGKLESLPVSSTKTKPPTSRKEFGLALPSKLAPSKNMVMSSECGDFFSFGSSKNDVMSLIDSYTSKLEEQPAADDRNETSDSPFLFASFGFETDQGQNDDDDGGLCFPSLFGGDSGKTSSSIFDDDTSSTNLFGGGGTSSASLFEEPEETSLAFPSSLPSTVPQIQKKEALQNIRDIMPTAASLTSNLFDW